MTIQDTAHGILICRERGLSDAKIAKALGIGPADVEIVLEKAREAKPLAAAGLSIMENTGLGNHKLQKKTKSEKVERIMAMHSHGVAKADIARDCEISINAVQRVIKTNGGAL